MRRIPYAAISAVVVIGLLSGCVTGGLDAETKAALRATMDSVQELTELWQERLDALDDGGATDDDDDDGRGTTPLVTTDASLSLTGSNLKTGTETSSLYDPDRVWQPIGAFPGTRDTWSYGAWGVRGMDGATPLFTATISGTRVAGGPNTAIIDPYSSSITGLREFSNPTGLGTAAWTGKVRGYETGEATFGTPVEGDAELIMDLDATLDTIDVDFTNFNRGHSNMSWTSIFVRLGSFRAYYSGRLEGKFYGDGHKGVAGTFESSNLKGVFGAVRE